MKSMQVVVRTLTGQIHRSSADLVEEREYEALKDFLKDINSLKYLEFDTDDGWVIINGTQIESVSVILV